MGKHVYVTVYVTTREYGGAEEGGWWYNWTEVYHSMLIGKKKRRHVQRVLREAKEYAESLDDGTEYWRVNHRGHYFAVVETTQGSKASKKKPIYC